MSLPNFKQFAVDEVLADSNQVVGIVDPEMVVRWVSASADAYGLDVVGRSIADLIHPDDLGRAAQAFDTAEPLDQLEPSLMANSIVSLRMVTPVGVVPFDASGRWVRDDEGQSWLIAILHDVTTRHAVDLALRKLAAGSNEDESIQAIITASRDYGGVRGAQIIWHNGSRAPRTFGDLGAISAAATDAIGEIAEIEHPASEIKMSDSDWGYAIPVVAGPERLGVFALWGIGPSPDIEFLLAAVSPLLDLAALAIKRARELAELERQATTDLVTGLLNRHAFFSELEETTSQSAVMYIDLDGFKTVNDEFGHTLGDRLLSVVSRRLTDAVDEDHVLGRIGGDEFAVLCRNVDAAQARTIGRRITGALNQTFVIDGHRVATGASIGIAYTECPLQGRALLDRADQALLEAKAQGKGRAVVLASL